MTKDLGEKLDEIELAKRASSTPAFITALAAKYLGKYGPLALVCVWFGFQIYLKDMQLVTLTEKVTTALIQSAHATEKLADAVEQLQHSR